MKPTKANVTAKVAQRAKELGDILHRQATLRAVIAGRTCPSCGSPIRRNSALTGWWQCSQYGSKQFRKNPDKPECNWQAFLDTEEGGLTQ